MEVTLRVITSSLVFYSILMICSLMVIYGYFGVFWRFIPDWPQALVIFGPLLMGLIFKIIESNRDDQNKLTIIVEKWLVRCGVFFLYWSILMTTSYAGGPKPKEYVYPIGIITVSVGITTGLLIIFQSSLWTLHKNALQSSNWAPLIKAKVLRTVHSRNVIIGSALILWLIISIQIDPYEPSKVIGEGYEYNAPVRFAPHFAGRSKNPLIGGYMTYEYADGAYELTRAKAVKATVTFNGTDESFIEQIQPDNYLGAGIAISGPDYMWGSTLSIDWGYSFIMFLNRSGGPYIQIEVWKAYEWFNTADKVISIAYSNPEYLNLNSSVSLVMEWDSLGCLNYYISVEGKPDLHLYCYYPDMRDSSSPYLYLTPPRFQSQVKYFQFIGAWSAQALDSPNWMTTVSSPEFVFKRGENWEQVAYAYSLSGVDALLDGFIRWGGLRYKGVDVRSYRTDPTAPLQKLTFFPSEELDYLQEGTFLWDSESPIPNITTEGSNLDRPWVYNLGPWIRFIVGVSIAIFIEVFTRVRRIKSRNNSKHA